MLIVDGPVDETMVQLLVHDFGDCDPQCLNVSKDKNQQKNGSSTCQVTVEKDWKSWSKLIQGCVDLSKTPLTLHEINREIKMIQGKDIPYRHLNYESLEEMINSISGLKVSQFNGISKVVKTYKASKQAYKFLANVRSGMKRKNQSFSKILFSKAAIKFFIFCVLTYSIGSNILLFLIDTPNTFEVNVRNDQTSMNKCSTCLVLKAPTIPPIGSIFVVHIIKAIDPDNFIVQPFNNLFDLETLMKDLYRFYESNSPLPVIANSLREGNIYAVKHDENGRWYRAYLSKIINKTNYLVYFCDYGEYRLVSLEQLQPLKNDFYFLPYQAIKAKLHGIIPKLRNGWTLNDSLRFNELIAVKNFVSVIKSPYEVENDSTKEVILGLELIDTTTPQGIYITNIFVEENRADRTE